MARFSIFLRIDSGTWARIRAETLPRRTLTVIAAFTLAAWNRLGSQAVLGPRAPVRMILTGVYGWIALAFALWLIAQRCGLSVRATPLHSLQRAATSVTVAHFPLIILGMYIATFGAFVRTPMPGTFLAIAVFAGWMPVLLGRAMQHLTDITRGRALLLIVVPYVLWLAWIGRYLNDQVGHLL